MNTEKSQPSGDLNPRQHVASIGMCHGSHTLTGMTFFLHSTMLKHIIDFSWLKVFYPVHYIPLQSSAKKARPVKAGSHRRPVTLTSLIKAIMGSYLGSYSLISYSGTSIKDPPNYIDSTFDEFCVLYTTNAIQSISFTSERGHLYS